MSSNNGAASSNGRPIPSPTRMVIGGIPSNTSFKSKGNAMGQDQDDEEQESFFVHPKSGDQFEN
jgi:hypothetical protein